MPVRWEIATLEPSATPKDDVAWVTQSGRRLDWDAARHGTLVALCDGPRVPDLGDHARVTALSELEDFYYFPPREDDPEQTLANAIAQALFIVKYYPADGQSSITAGSGAVDGSSSTARSDELAMIAAVVKHGTLYVAHSGRYRACVWRKGELVLLAVDPTPSSAIGHAHYELARNDRVLLCSEEIYQQVPAARVADILGTEQGTDCAIKALLGAAAIAQPTTTSPISVAILDYESIFADVTLPIAAIAGISALVLLALSLWFASRLSSTQNPSALASPFASSTPAPTLTLSETQPPTPVQMPSTTPAGILPAAGLGGAQATATATVRPLPSGTTTSTLALAPTRSETPIQTPVPVSISATSPNPTATSDQATPQAQSVPRTETATRPPMTPTAIQLTAVPRPTVLASATSIPPTLTPTPTPTTPEPLAESVRALNPQRVILSKESIPITLTAQVSLTAPAAYVINMRRGQTLYVQVTHTAFMKVLNAQGQSLTFPGQSVQFPIMQTGDYIIVVAGEGAVTVNITVSLPSPP